MTTYRAATPHHPGTADGEPTAVSNVPQPMSRTFEMAMSPVDVHVAAARDTSAALLRRWALPDPTVEEARLIVSELVTNAIKHGSGAVKLRVQYGSHQVRIEVTDGSRAPARRRRAGTNDVSGRGLFLVACLSQRWGTTHDGRTTYAVVPAPPEVERGPATALDPTPPEGLEKPMASATWGVCDSGAS
ncbi:ATP-binding protein [Streptomyces endophyticus]|uniref:ATP-binding protein n=1 Tax=Streptomyces endophyticus TaxID=714166 RepID=A0ABU6FH77_9ACTN|nr:ATP-binding protein [Streptomyces endophyticus]MEB8343416.1 ATP-binding protein [Streptomyces endophyticus]